MATASAEPSQIDIINAWKEYQNNNEECDIYLSNIPNNSRVNDDILLLLRSENYKKFGPIER